MSEVRTRRLGQERKYIARLNEQENHYNLKVPPPPPSVCALGNPQQNHSYTHRKSRFQI
jgi:hypothetical protein